MDAVTSNCTDPDDDDEFTLNGSIVLDDPIANTILTLTLAGQGADINGTVCDLNAVLVPEPLGRPFFMASASRRSRFSLPSVEALREISCSQSINRSTIAMNDAPMTR